MKLNRKPYQRRDEWKTVDMAAVRADLIEALRAGPKDTEQLVQELHKLWTRHAVMRAIRYARDDGYIHREKHDKPWTLK